MSFVKQWVVALLLCFSFFSNGQAWWDGGHMVIAEIAHQHLNPSVKDEVNRLLGLFPDAFPNHHTFMTSSVWADSLRKRGVSAFDTWHYINYPYDPEGILSEAQRREISMRSSQANILFALQQSIRTLKSDASKDFEKALMLRFLIHFVGDAHQPLHTTTLYNARFPEGDAGGNHFKIRSAVASNLHKFWDSGLGAFPVVNAIPTSSQRQNICRYAKQSISRYPESSLEDAKNLNPYHWLRESHELAKGKVYRIKQFTEPSLEYIAEGQDVSQRQVVLAGYRLANLLNEIFDSKREGQ
jgi:hypothetical protein